ncbi:hypothetical protein [Jannaschia ovalis]|uniref:Uncharacterized protein n=1 Tax=Jannaschia ovalis TaxID=3038773 RepID=A0ABY8LGL8_9RHOB|nr:hypothetical protein [Jannaschia sp. GRR-S6-38]WGH80423.1 hypothetical protein P8627_00665 [Jannaschia sp. GRR-S6-38]
MMGEGADDPKGLIREAYRIEGISPAECRSIFLDWALSVEDARAAIPRLLQGRPEHPMTDVLREGLAEVPQGRRGGRAARLKA